METELAKAKAQGYSLGYASGKKAGEAKFKELERTFERKILTASRQRNNYNRVFLVGLQVALTQSTWTVGGKKINTIEQRVKLAQDFAEEAVKKMV